MHHTRDLGTMNRWLGWTLLLTTLCCRTAHEQEATPAAEHPVYYLRADAERDLVEETTRPQRPSLLTDHERLRLRRALNLELAGWIISGASVPGLFTPSYSCSRARVGFRAPVATLSFGFSSGLVGTILRVRRMRGRGRMNFRERQELFRSPVGRALGFTGLFLGAFAAAVIVPLAEVPFSCRD